MAALAAGAARIAEAWQDARDERLQPTRETTTSGEALGVAASVSMSARRAVVSWSGGKDSAFALERVARELEVVGLFTTLDAETGRVFHHDVPEALIESQADALGLRLNAVRIPPDVTEAVYGALMSDALGGLIAEGVDAMVFGDIHLNAVRARRETKLRGTGIEPVFPVWGVPPDRLAREMIDEGLEATIVSIDTRRVGRQALGQPWDQSFLDALPRDADRCGERGEYHTFVTRSPRFRWGIESRVDTVVERPPFAAAILTTDSSRGSSIRHEEGVGWIEEWQIGTDEPFLESLLTRLFQEHWNEITFGPLLQGSAWEVSPRSAPHALTVFDGYLTAHFEELHFHLCIGETKGDEYALTSPSLAARRRVSKAALFRRINRDGTPDTWGLRLFNGAGEQQITILFPNPFLSSENVFRVSPDWSCLELWDTLRTELLGLEPDHRDRTGRRMIYP